jgi:uncharacterized protein (DUF2336 family)
MISDAFLRWIETAPAAQRAEGTDALARSWLHADLPKDERDGLESVMTVLLDDPAPIVRKALALALADAEDAPRHVILGLAHDQPEIAAIVARRSPVLSEGELVDLIATSDWSVQAAVAERWTLTKSLCAALCEVGDAPACVCLALNLDAPIPAFSLKRLADRLGEDPHVREALLSRPNLPLTIRHLLVDRLSTALEKMVSAMAWLSAERASRVTREARDKATVTLAADAREADMRALIEHLRAAGQLSTALVLRAICTGNIRFFEEALASLAGLPASRVYAFVADGREAALDAVYRKAGIPERTVPAFRAAIATYKELELDGQAGDGVRFSRRMIERVLTRYQDFAADERDDLLTLLRRFAAEAARDAARAYALETRQQPAVALPARAPDDAALIDIDHETAEAA